MAYARLVLEFPFKWSLGADIATPFKASRLAFIFHEDQVNIHLTWCLLGAGEDQGQVRTVLVGVEV
jgi:hypothetical protein